MTDNAIVYPHGRRFRDLLATHQTTHIRIPPYTPRWNGKVERFIQTLADRMGLQPQLAQLTPRARSLQSFIRYYNRQRPHSSLADRPPISRVHNVRGQDT